MAIEGEAHLYLPTNTMITNVSDTVQHEVETICCLLQAGKEEVVAELETKIHVS